MSKPRFLSVVNVERYQHYKDRHPPWVKLHRDFISDHTMQSLPVESRLFFVCCFILASETGNLIPFDLPYLSNRLAFPVSLSTVTPLIHSGRLLASGASRSLACLLSSTLSSPTSSLHPNPSLIQKEGKSTDTNYGTKDFETFWSAYPRKIGKQLARQAWNNQTAARPPLAVILEAVKNACESQQWRKDDGQYIPHPSTWLHQERWTDVPTKAKLGVFEDFLARGETQNGESIWDNFEVTPEVERQVFGDAL